MLIEKEDAIKAVCEACYMYKYIGEHYKECKYYPCDDIKALEAITEAQKPSGDIISRADAIEAVWYEIDHGYTAIVDRIKALPSAEATCATCADRALCIMSAPDGKWKACKDYRPSVEAVHKPDYSYEADMVKRLRSAEAVQLRQTDTLIIADALRYLEEDTERHPSDRARAEILRGQMLQYGASMCKGGEDE